MANSQSLAYMNYKQLFTQFIPLSLNNFFHLTSWTLVSVEPLTSLADLSQSHLIILPQILQLQKPTILKLNAKISLFNRYCDLLQFHSCEL